MKNVFAKEVSSELVSRINNLNQESKPIWGKMNVDQMLAHCNVTYEMAFTDKHPKATGIKKFMLNLFVKQLVVGEKPFKKNGRTAPQFLITIEKVFNEEKIRLIDFINKTQDVGESYFEGKESNSFGVLTVKEWSNSFYKHLDHHLKQFGV